MKKFKVEYLQKNKLIDAGECELLDCFQERLKLRNSRVFYLPVCALTEASRSELEKLLENEND